LIFENPTLVCSQLAGFWLYSSRNGYENHAHEYRKIYGGESIPVIKSAVITGRAEMRPVGPITFPARFRFTHDAGKGYRHYIEATVFGLPLLQVNERYLDGHGRMELPFAPFDISPRVKYNLALDVPSTAMSKLTR
jgi:hypothetical protein